MKPISRRRATAALFASVALVVAACGGDDTTPLTEPSATPVPAIDGKTYLSESVSGHDLVEGSVLRVSFDGGNLGAHAGCNQMGGAYTLEDATLVVGQMFMTEMACVDPPGLMDQEVWFADFLGDRPTIAQDGDRLTLTTGDVTVVFLDREVADPDRALEGTTWIVTSAIDASSVSSVSAGGSLVLAEGVAQVSTGCNTGSGPYTLSDDGSTIEFGPIGLTRMACVDDEAARLEQAMVEVLQGTVTVEIEAASLTLMHGETGLQFTAQD